MNPMLKIIIFLTASGVLTGVSAQDAVIHIEAGQEIHPVSRLLTGACIEDVNHEIYGGLYSQMIFGESFQEPEELEDISGMWRPAYAGNAKGEYAIRADNPFVGAQSQLMRFQSGDGVWGVENRGLNRQGMNFVANKAYEGQVWARAAKPTTLFVALESGDGSHVYAEKPLVVTSAEWQRLDFTLTPDASDASGRFSLKLKQAGSVVLGYAFLQPGEWGRFKGLPVRRDVAEGLIAQGITVLRYGGSMVNNPGYRWKKMIGPRERRPPYAGHWYRHSSNGFGIPGFMDFCEAAGFEAIPDFCIDETPQDMADFMDYAKAPADSEWGRRRAADGHSAPYNLKYIELGNEERVDERYVGKFEALAKVIWAKDRDIILVVGDFVYSQAIRDPFNFRGSASGITSLAAQQRILRLAKQHDREVWFDIHVGTDGPRPDATFAGMLTFINSLERLADGARFKVAVFEFNAGNHGQKRALANALAIQAIEGDGRIAVAASANCLQPDGQNDNGWDQGLLFLNPSKVWLQAPGYVTQMFSNNYQPTLVKCEVAGAANKLDANAKRSDDGKTLVLQVVNTDDAAVTAQIHIAGFAPGKPEVQVTELSGPLDAVNTADRSDAIIPRQSTWNHPLKDGDASHTFPPHSFTVLRFGGA